MKLDEILKQAEEFEKEAQARPLDQGPSAHAEKELKNRELREKTREIKLLAEAVEKKYLELKYAGFMTNFALMRDLNKAKAYLEDALKIIVKAQ